MLLQGKLLHCEPPPGVDSVVFKPPVSDVKKEKTHAHTEKQSASTVSVLHNSRNKINLCVSISSVVQRKLQGMFLLWSLCTVYIMWHLMLCCQCNTRYTSS